MSPQTIKKNRIAAGLSQESLAQRLGVMMGTIRNWERGICVPRLSHAKALYDFFKRLEGE